MTSQRNARGDAPLEETRFIGGVENRAIIVVPYRQDCPKTIRQHREGIASAIGTGALGTNQVGAAALPGLAAKPMFDMLGVVADSADKDTYRPAGEIFGQVLRVHEPEFEEHRMFRTPVLDVHTPVFSDGPPEIERYLRFHDALRAAPFLRALPEAQPDAGSAGLAGQKRLCPGKVRGGRGDHRLVDGN